MASLGTIHDLPTPALLLDLDRLESNLHRMAERARRFGVALRPHVKTHKCLEVAERQQALGVRGITVSTLYEARVFADHGYEDITWAFPVILNRLAEVAELADRVTLRLVVDSTEAVTALEGLGRSLHVWLKVDCGYHRAGVDPASPEALALARRIAQSPRLVFDGILTHSGHAYHGPTLREVAAAAEEERSVMAGFAERLRQEGIEVPEVSVGSTPALAVAKRLDGATEIRPGNYCFHDFMQVHLGSCRVERLRRDGAGERRLLPPVRRPVGGGRRRSRPVEGHRPGAPAAADDGRGLRRLRGEHPERGRAPHLSLPGARHPLGGPAGGLAGAHPSQPFLPGGGAIRRVRGGPRRGGPGPLEDLARPVTGESHDADVG